MSHYILYYDDHIGGGGVRNFFSGSTYQRERGIGSWLGGLIRRILPYVASGAKAVGKEAVRAGINIFHDVANNGSSSKKSIKYRAKESGKNLQRKAGENIMGMTKGTGYKSIAVRRKRQLRKARSAVSIGRKKRKQNSRRKKKKAPSNTKRRKKQTLRSVADIFGPRQV